jgi:outer membrane lipoprotein SlyB
MARTAPILCLLLAAALLGCTKKPVLYPNATYQRAGKRVAEHEVEACIHWAKAAGAQANRAGRVAGDTVGGAAVGGAAGAAAGAVRGSAGTGAAMGAAGAAAGGLVRGLLRWREPDEVERHFVERCLRERGYEPVGWR